MHGATKGWFDKKKLDRTHITSGEQLDDYKYDSTRFTEITDETRNDIQERLEKMGKMFQDHVKKHRADKLDQNELQKIFSADVVLGEEAIDLGLVDKIGIIDEVMAEKHEGLEIRDFSKRNPFEALKANLGAQMKIQMQEKLLKKLMRTNI